MKVTLINKISITLCLLSLVGCGSTRIVSKIEKSSSDVLKGESLARYSEDQLQALAKSSDPLVKGAALCQLKDFKAGEEVLLKQVDHMRQNPLFWNALVVCNLNAGVYQKSEFYLSLALGIKGVSSEVSSMLKTNQGLLFLKLRHYQAARQSFEEALALNPQATTPKFNLAHLYLKFALFDKAHAYLTDLISISPQDPDIISAMGTYYTMTRVPKKALSYFAKLSNELRLREDISNAYALALFQDGQYEEAYLAIEHAQSTVIPSLRQSKQEIKMALNQKLKELRLAKLQAQNQRQISSENAQKD